HAAARVGREQIRDAVVVEVRHLAHDSSDWNVQRGCEPATWKTERNRLTTDEIDETVPVEIGDFQRRAGIAETRAEWNLERSVSETANDDDFGGVIGRQGEIDVPVPVEVSMLGPDILKCPSPGTHGPGNDRRRSSGESRDNRGRGRRKRDPG